MQLADIADLAPCHAHARAAPRVHGRVLGRFELRLQRGQQRLDVAFNVEEVHALLLASPLQRLCRAIGQACDAHGLVKALDRGV